MTINATRKIISLTGPNCSFGNTNACRVDVVAAGSTWQLASGHWVPRKFDAVIAHPRPTAETAVYEQHRNAYPGLAYSTRVLVFGGAYPFRFELVAGPAGMTIGETLVASGDVLVEPSNYGMVEWANPTAGDHTVTVRVYDQDYGRTGNPSGYVEVTWTLTVGTSNWVFIDPVNGNNANAGTLAAPFADTTPFITGSTYANKCVMVRQGTMNLVGMGGGNYAANADAPKTFVGYPGETATINMDTGQFSVTAEGFCLKDLTVQHGMTPYAASQRIVGFQSGTHRGIMVGCTIPHFEIGSAPSAANPGVFVPINSTTAVDYLCMCYNTFTGQQGPGWHSFEVNKAVIHGNDWNNATLSEFDGSVHALIFFKDSTKSASVRCNTAWDSLTSGGEDAIFGFMGQIDAEDTYGVQNLEFCYNTFYMSGYASREATLREYYNTTGHGDIDNYHLYRNTFGTTNNAETSLEVVTNSTRSYNVFTGGSALDSSAGTTDSNNLESGNFVDLATMKLTGASRTSYLGTHGAEIF